MSETRPDPAAVTAKAFMECISGETYRRAIEMAAVLGGWVGAREAGFRDVHVSDAISKAALAAVMDLFRQWTARVSRGGIQRRTDIMTDTRALSGAFVDDLRERLTDALGAAWGPACVDRAIEAVAPVLQHAEDAAMGSHEGVRLWMLDCGELVAEHRARADAAEAALGRVRKLAEDWRQMSPEFRAAEAGTYILKVIKSVEG